MNDEMELVCFNLISNSGAAKSSYIEAIQLAKAAKIDEAKQKLTEAEGFLVNAHKIHAELIQKEAAGQKVEFSLLFMHAEDQFASTEMAQLLAKELIDLYSDKFANK
ncbi:MAG: PTS lactose/cellobiose transporter subunit IIA [Ligilactobacillus agilis]|nr:PTS lactose/cellobiose transporter subunit IIA [Ligilactobacillus agilis]